MRATMRATRDVVPRVLKRAGDTSLLSFSMGNCVSQGEHLSDRHQGRSMSRMMGVRGLGHYYFGNWKRGLVEFRDTLL